MYATPCDGGKCDPSTSQCDAGTALGKPWRGTWNEQDIYNNMITLGPQNHEKWRFYTPNIWVITTKNEGYGFPWYMDRFINTC